MGRRFRLIAIFAVLLVQNVHGAEEVLELPLQKVKSLTAVVTYPNGDPVKRARVVELGSDWKTEIRATVTDSEGRFTLEPIKGRKVYYVQVSAPEAGVNTLRVPLTISHWWGKAQLKLRLEFA